MAKKVDARAEAFMEFFRKQGVKFVDVETGEEIKPEKGKNNGLDS